MLSHPSQPLSSKVEEKRVGNRESLVFLGGTAGPPLRPPLRFVHRFVGVLPNAVILPAKLLLLRQWREFFHWRHLVHLVWKECPDPTAPLRADAPSCLDPSDFRHSVRDAVCVVLVLVLRGDVCRKWGKAAGFHVHPHQLRYSHATHAVQRGVDVFTLQATLGHSSSATTGHYVASNPRDSSSLRLG